MGDVWYVFWNIIFNPPEWWYKSTGKGTPKEKSLVDNGDNHRRRPEETKEKERKI